MISDLSPAQQEAATTFGCDVCVSAGAGSGKTRVLVSRFVRAVECGDPPDRILALTFTEKAANVMKTRLVDAFLKRALHAERRAVERAYIGTIDSFCTRVLRENPIEAGIDPTFSVLSQGEAEILMVKAMDSVFEAQADHAAWLSILVEIGEDKLRKALVGLYAQYRALGEDGSILKNQGGPDRVALQQELVRSLQEAADGISAKKGPGKTEAAVLEAARAFPRFFEGRLGWDVYHEIVSMTDRIQRKGALAGWADAFKSLVEEWKLAACQELYAPSKEEFLRVFREFCIAYENEKRSRAACDFSDLLIVALRLLSSAAPEKKAVLTRYREKFRHIFVDEFQDTSPLQARLIELLHSGKNLFLVGDPQQSIYSFRYADPELFLKYEKAAKSRLRLGENYRSRPAVLDFVNGFFQTQAAGPFLPLISAKSFELTRQHEVEALCTMYGPDERCRDIDQAREREAELLAESLVQLKTSGDSVEDGTITGRPMRWGDAAILLRGTKKVAVYERALARRGIPFYSVRSKGFFETPEIKDIVNFLILLDHPDDDSALASVLRSPLVGVSDDGLFWLAQTAKKKDPKQPLARALDRLNEVEGLSGVDLLRTVAFGDFIERTRSVKNRFTVSAAIEEVLKWSDYECQVLTQSGGAQEAANVRKLVEIARCLETKTPLDASDFVRYVRGMEDVEEAEARIEGEDQNAVLISTIHSAKGLEFPFVFLANLGGKKPPTKGGLVLASTRDGLGWITTNEDNEKMPDTSYKRALDERTTKNAEEESRLFYVAMTRAEERLIFCGTRKAGAASESTWMAQILSSAPGKELNVKDAVEPRALSAVVSAGRSGETLLSQAEIARRISFPKKPYDIAFNQTVSDVLSGLRPNVEVVLSEEPEEVDLEDLERSPRNEFGTIFHRIMELSLTRKGIDGFPEKIFDAVTAPLTSAERKEIRHSAEKFWAGEWGDSLKKARRVYSELPFIYKTTHGLLKGQIDLVYQRSDGGWVILDYKTNRLTGPADKKKAIEGYRAQLGLYALAFWKLAGEIPTVTVLYFSFTGESEELNWDAEKLETLASSLEEFYRQSAAAKPA